MAKFELSLSPDYVPSWTVIDAVRELFQNALDQQTTVEGNEMFFDYEEDYVDFVDNTGREQVASVPSTLRIGNKKSILQSKTLLLGSSSKADDPNTIGQFGEGYKVAVLVLLRNGKSVTFYNYGAREVWKTRFKESRKYGGRILEFEIDKKYIWQSVPDNNLTIEVGGVTADEYQAIVESNLHLQGDLGEVIDTKIGRILKNPAQAKKVYVNGLFVCEYPPYVHGYDFIPSAMKLDRDRKMADPFQLKWKASDMWVSSGDFETAAALSAKGAADVEFMAHMLAYSMIMNSTIADTAVDNFILEHGSDAVPVSNNEELKQAQEAGRKAVMVPAPHQQVMKSSSKYESVAVPVVERMSTKDALEMWLDNHRQSLSRRAILEMNEIIEGVNE